jgi:hypothetical protein
LQLWCTDRVERRDWLTWLVHIVHLKVLLLTKTSSDPVQLLERWSFHFHSITVISLFACLPSCCSTNFFLDSSHSRSSSLLVPLQRGAGKTRYWYVSVTFRVFFILDEIGITRWLVLPQGHTLAHLRKRHPRSLRRMPLAEQRNDSNISYLVRFRLNDFISPKTCKVSDCSCPNGSSAKSSTSCINGSCSCNNPAASSLTDGVTQGVSAIGKFLGSLGL